MRVRTYGLLLLVMVGVAPLTIYGVSSVRRAENTTEYQLRAGHAQVARAIAGRIAASAEANRRLIATVGMAVLHAVGERNRRLTLEIFSLGYPHLHDIAVYDHDGSLIAGQEPLPDRSQYRKLAQVALTGKRAQSAISTGGIDELFAHTITIGEPVEIVGKRAGVIVARYDLVGIWPAVNSVRVGKTGFIRLLAYDGRLLAHGHPEERRRVFEGDHQANAELVVGALLQQPVRNRQGEHVVASIASVPGFPGMIVVEQEATEALSSVRDLEQNLLILACAGLVFAVFIGMLFGRELVDALEQMRQHVGALPGNLQHRLKLRSRLVEVQTLADTLNDMASKLASEREAAKTRERLTTFARVAAGLAHDLRMPIEAVRGAIELACDRPDNAVVRRLIEKARSRDIPRLTRFMDDLQRLAHEGNLGLDYERVAPSELALEIQTELSSAPKWSGVEFTVRGSAQTAILDRNLVRRALTNLVGNGADACLAHSPTGQVIIDVADCDDMLEFRVHDTGVGISPERIQSLKHSDFQSTKRTSGVGLGLGVVRQVLEAHGGAMQITSELGVGSVFIVRLPRAPVAKESEFGRQQSTQHDRRSGRWSAPSLHLRQQKGQ